MIVDCRLKIAMIVLALSCAVAFAQAPVIKDFSSTGGHPRNKTGPKDTMYLVKPGDKITFSVKTDGAEKYEWQVNKEADAEAAGETFAWTVPNEKGIWEIHLKATGGGNGGEVHQEWVVSTLPVSEAPDFLEYFTDRKVADRTETDPWGRKLPEWTYFKPEFGRGSVADGYLKKGPPKEVRVRLDTDFKHTFGTWKIRYMYPHGAMGYRGVGMDFRDGKGGHFKYEVMTEEHDYSGVESYEGKQRQRIRYQIGRRDVCFGPNFWITDTKADQWHTFMFIHTEDGYFYAFYDGQMMWNSLGWDDRDIRVGQLEIDCNFYPDEPRFADLVKFDRYVDGMEFYDRKYLFPDNGIEYKPYVARTSIIPERSHKEPGYYEETKKDGIVIGRHGATLAEIASAVGRPEVFSYDAKSKKAVCRTNIVVQGGAQLVIKGETLLMDSKSEAPLEFVLRNGSELDVLDSTIGTTGQGYFRWKIASVLDSYVHPGMYPNRAMSFDGILEIRNSTIDNCAHVLIEGARKLIVEDSRFTNLVEIEPIEDYSDGGYDRGYNEYRKTLKKVLLGRKAVWFFNRQKMSGFSLKNVLFSGKSGAKPVAIAFIGGDYSGVCDIYDIRFENAYARTAPSRPYAGITGVRWQDKIIPRTVSLINCNPQKTVAEENSSVLMKYYLDLKVLDAKGALVAGAKVTVTNETDDAGFPSENAVEKLGWAHEYLQKNLDPLFVMCWPANGVGVANHQLLIDANDMRTTVTSPNGHTPPPSDKKQTLILTDSVQDKAGKKEFTYAITVEKNGLKKVITGVNPGPDWYRPEPNKPTYTITAVLDGKTVTEAELEK